MSPTEVTLLCSQQRHNSGPFYPQLHHFPACFAIVFPQMLQSLETELRYVYLLTNYIGLPFSLGHHWHPRVEAVLNEIKSESSVACAIQGCQGKK